MPIEKENEVREKARLEMERVRHGQDIFIDTTTDTNRVDDIKPLLQKCNVPDPPTGEEDTTIHQIIRASSPMNMKIDTYSAET